MRTSGQINMRKIDGWQTLHATSIDQPVDLESATLNWAGDSHQQFQLNSGSAPFNERREHNMRDNTVMMNDGSTRPRREA